MPDRLDERIRALVVELVESSPPPLPSSEVFEPAYSRPRPVWSTALRVAVAALVVLAVGTTSLLIGRYVFPAAPVADGITVVPGTIGPEPQFSTAGLGDEVLLLPPSGAVPDDLFGSPLVGEVAAVGRIEGTTLDVFAWRTRENGLEGRCVQVLGPYRESTCSSGQDGVLPYSFPDRTADGTITGIVITGRVPASTSVVSLSFLESDDIRLWQRPVEGVAAFVVDDPSLVVTFLTAMDAQGEILGRIEFRLWSSEEFVPDPLGEYDRADDLPASHPAAPILAAGAIDMDAFSEAASAERLRFVCASGGGHAAWELCLVAADGILGVVPFGSATGLVAIFGDPALERDVLVPLDSAEPVGIRAMGPTRVEIEYFGVRVGGMSTPWLEATHLPFSVAFNLSNPEPFPGSESAGGSGCAVDGEVLPDGAWFGFVLSRDATTITFDPACFYSGEEAERQAALDGEELANPYYIRNEDPTTFLVPVDPGALMYALFHDAEGAFELRPIALSAWPDPDSPWPCPGEFCLVWLYVNDGVITEVVEQYLP